MPNLLSLRALRQYEDLGYTIPSAIELLVFASCMSFHTASVESRHYHTGFLREL
jgi:hypothetical protein